MGEMQVDNEELDPNRLTAVFIDRSSQPPIMHNHLPLMMSAISNGGSDPKMWLVPLPNFSEGRLCEVLQVPRVGLIGVKDTAPGARALLDFVKKNVKAVDSLQPNSTQLDVFHSLKIDSYTTKVQVMLPKAKRRKLEKESSKTDIK
jgi:hypothetical protein